MKTPFFLIQKELLDKNIQSFSNALAELWPNSCLGYSVKTNSLPWILRYLLKKGVYAEVVSDEEYRLATLVQYPSSRIIFNGPIKGEEQFKKACSEGAILNIDSHNDLLLLRKYGNSDSKVGIRVNLPPDIFDESDVGYEEDGFRFGFCEKKR